MDKPPLPPRMLTKAEAAAYAAGGSIPRFDRMRRLGLMPKRVPGTTLFDRCQIDAAIDKMVGEITESKGLEESPLVKFQRERDERKRNDPKRQRH